MRTALSGTSSAFATVSETTVPVAKRPPTSPLGFGIRRYTPTWREAGSAVGSIRETDPRKVCPGYPSIRNTTGSPTRIRRTSSTPTCPRSSRALVLTTVKSVWPGFTASPSSTAGR